MQMRLEHGGGLVCQAGAAGRGWRVRTSQEGLCFGVEAEPHAVEQHTQRPSLR